MHKKGEGLDRSGGIEPHLAATSGDRVFFCDFLMFLLMMLAPEVAVLLAVPKEALLRAEHLLVEGLGVGGGGRDVGVTGSLVGAGGELELVGRLQVGIAGGAVGGGVVLEVEKKGEHCVVNPPTHLLRLYWGKRRRELAGIIEILDRGRGHFLGLQKRQKT